MIVGPHQSDSAAGAVATASTVSNDRATCPTSIHIHVVYVLSRRRFSISFEDMRHDYPQSQWGTAPTGCGLQVRVAQKMIQFPNLEELGDRERALADSAAAYVYHM